MNTWFTADTHFGHAAILRHQINTRPFDNLVQMENKIIDNINELVMPCDTLYHLGDFCWKNSLLGHFRNRINCRRIILIKGNHEAKGMDKLRSTFSEVHDLKKIKVEGQEIVLFHYAMRVWNKSHHGVWHLYGHSHGSLPDSSNSLSMDVGVDCHNLYPISFFWIKQVMNTKKFQAIDHHGKDE